MDDKYSHDTTEGLVFEYVLGYLNYVLIKNEDRMVEFVLSDLC